MFLFLLQFQRFFYLGINKLQCVCVRACVCVCTHNTICVKYYLIMLYCVCLITFYFLLPHFSTFIDIFISDRICKIIYSIHKTTIVSVTKIYSHHQELKLSYILAR